MSLHGCLLLNYTLLDPVGGCNCCVKILPAMRERKLSAQQIREFSFSENDMEFKVQQLVSVPEQLANCGYRVVLRAGCTQSIFLLAPAPDIIMATMAGHYI